MPRTIKSQAAIAHAAEYQKSKFVSVGTSISRSTADDFRRWCAERGTTPHAEIKKFIESTLDKPNEE